MTFEEAKTQAVKNLRATKVSEIFKVMEEAAELYAKNQYNQALEDMKTRIELLQTVGCDICGGGFRECGCVQDGRNAGLKEAIEELKKLKK